MDYILSLFHVEHIFSLMARTKSEPVQQVLAIDFYSLEDAINTIKQQLDQISDLNAKLEATLTKLKKVDPKDGFTVTIGEPAKVFHSFTLTLKL